MKTTSFVFGLISLLWIPAALAQGSPENTSLSPTVRQCVFEKTLEIGASVTGQLGEVVPLYGPLTTMIFDAGRTPYRGSPSSEFVTHYRNMGLLFAGPKYKVGSGVPENTAAMVTNKISDVGTGQVESLLTGDKKDKFAQATLILGIDLFYWDAIWDQCGYGKARFHRQLGGRYDNEVRRSDTEYQIARFIQASKQAGKTLFLGTVPHEVAENVKINRPGMWYPQTPACVDSINATLLQHCTVENRCYLLDLRATVDVLNSGQSIFIPALNRSFSLYDMRPDGVHLSEVGSLYVFDQMVKKFEAQPPTCQ